MSAKKKAAKLKAYAKKERIGIDIQRQGESITEHYLTREQAMDIAIGISQLIRYEHRASSPQGSLDGYYANGITVQWVRR